MTTVVQAAIDEQNPWPGLGSFDEGAERFFNGRRIESAELRRLVVNAPLTVLFGASGLGKTSLVQAGLFPLLRREHHLPIYVRLDLHDRTAPLLDQVMFALQAQLHARGIDAPPTRDDEPLWSYLHRDRLELWSGQNQLLTPVFVLDQFEEVFTIGAQNPGAIARLRVDLADLIENRVPAALADRAEGNEAAGEGLSLDSQRYRVVLSFREDFLAAVEGWKRELPSILRNRLRLLPMSGEQAFEAVHRTASTLVDEPLARQIVRFVAAAQEDGGDKGAATPDSMSELSVEPALLSLVCHGLNEKRKAQNKAAFDDTLLKGTGQSIISDYYQAATADVSAAAQQFIRNELITERGFRKPCDIDDARSVHGVTDEELRLLVDRRVLRIEAQRSTQRVELTHDLLTRVVREHRDREREKARTRRQRRRLAAFAAVGVVLLGLVMMFGWLYVKAEQQATIATARRLAAEARTISSQRPRWLPLATLLAVESIKRYPTLDADQFVRFGLPLLPRSATPPLKHASRVQAVAFSPDGTRLATASSDGAARVWDAATGRLIFATAPDQVNVGVSAVAFSPDGKLLATGDAGGTTKVWDVGSGVLAGPARKSRIGHPIQTVAFSRDGTYLVGASEGGADVWNAEANQVFSTPERDGAFSCIPLSSFSFSPDGTHAAAACRGQIRIWETASWKTIATIPHKPRPGLTPPRHPIAFSPDGKYLASADEVYEVGTGRLALELHSRGPITTVVFGGAYIALGSGETVRVVDMLNGADLAELRHADAIRAVTFSPRGDQIATASNDNTARIWKVNRYAGEGPSYEVTRIIHEGEVSSIDFSPDGRYLATGGEDGTVRVWRVDADARPAYETHWGSDRTAVCISSTGRFAAVAEGDAVQVREAATGREVGHAAYKDQADSRFTIDGVNCSPDGRYLWTTRHRTSRRGKTEAEKVARVWDATTQEEVAQITYDAGERFAVFSPDATHLAADDGASLQIWDLTAKREAARIKHERALVAPVFSADGRYLVVVEEKATRILETHAWREVRSLPAVDGASRVLAISRNGKYIARGSAENVGIWEVSSGRAITSLPVKGVRTILFGPDSTHVATANWNYSDPSDRSVQVWNIGDGHEVGRLQLLEKSAPSNVRTSETQLAFSEDGGYLASENQGTIRIWDLMKEQETERWESLTERQLVFSLDGKYLLAWNESTGSMWHLDPAVMIAEACARLGRSLTRDEWHQYLGDESYRQTCPEPAATERIPSVRP